MSITRIGIAQSVAGVDSSQRRTDSQTRAGEGAPNGVPSQARKAAEDPTSKETAGGREPVAPGKSTGGLKATVKLPDIPLRELSMTLDPDAKRIVIKVIDSETKDVLRQIPAEETLQLLQELPGVRGLLLDKKG